jgi:hypothetical protein
MIGALHTLEVEIGYDHLTSTQVRSFTNTD